MILYMLKKREVFSMPVTHELVYEWETVDTSTNKEDFKKYENNSDYRIIEREII